MYLFHTLCVRITNDDNKGTDYNNICINSHDSNSGGGDGYNVKTILDGPAFPSTSPRWWW